jgi:hypothetical protein
MPGLEYKQFNMLAEATGKPTRTLSDRIATIATIVGADNGEADGAGSEGGQSGQARGGELGGDRNGGEQHPARTRRQALQCGSRLS